MSCSRLRFTVCCRRLGRNNFVAITTSVVPAITHPPLRRSNRFPPVAGVGPARHARLARPNPLTTVACDDNRAVEAPRTYDGRIRAGPVNTVDQPASRWLRCRRRSRSAPPRAVRSRSPAPGRSACTNALDPGTSPTSTVWLGACSRIIPSNADSKRPLSRARSTMRHLVAATVSARTPRRPAVPSRQARCRSLLSYTVRPPCRGNITGHEHHGSFGNRKILHSERPSGFSPG